MKIQRMVSAPLKALLLSLIGLFFPPFGSQFDVRADCDPTPPDLAGWWPGNGSTVDVVSGSIGTLTNGAFFGAGEVGQAFTMTNDHAGVIVGNLTNLQLQVFTIEGWIKRASSTNVTLDPGAANMGSLLFGYGNQGYGFGLLPNGVLDFTKIGDTWVGAGPVVTDTNFHHVAVSYDGTNVIFYVDGAAVTYDGTNVMFYYNGVAYPTSSTYSVTFQFTTSASIGVVSDLVNSNNNCSFWGTLDEFSVYNRVLLPGEIAAIYSAGSAGKCNTNGLAIISIVKGPCITFTGILGNTYGIQYTDVLSPSNTWTGATNYTATATTNIWCDTTSVSNRFYRISPGPISIP